MDDLVIEKLDTENLEVESKEATSDIAGEKSEDAKSITSTEPDAPKNEFSYLERNEFTSEIYKIEVRNLGYFGIGEFKKLLKSKLNLDMTKIKSPKQKDFAFVCFRSQEMQERALATLNGYKWKNRVLVATIAKAAADPLMKRRNEENNKGGNDSKRIRTSAEATCPLASIAYKDQLIQKSNEMSGVLKKYFRELTRINRGATKYINEFKFEGVIPSPKINGYRNKNEFTVGKDSSGSIVVGFRLGSYSDGSVEVSDVQALPHLSDQAKWAARSYQKFVRQSNFLPFNAESNSGHFRQLMVRTSATTGELMLVAGIYSSNLNETELAEIKAELKAFYETENAESQKYICTSLYYQDVKHREAGQMVNPVEHLLGTTYITDSIQDLQFRISPLAFFQINTEGANVLYQKAIEFIAPRPETTVLDICCGTGTIALALSKHCKNVLGVEIIPDAVKDAEHNAAVNNITNCKFYTGNADDFIKSMVKEARYGAVVNQPLDITVVIDPPRAGLHTRSIAAIRAESDIKRLVYISCNPERAKRNFIELSREKSKQYKGLPFYPKRAVAVDMFPHTLHTELVILFERQEEENVDS